MAEKLKYIEELEGWRNPTEDELSMIKYNYYGLCPTTGAIENIQVCDVVIIRSIGDFNGDLIVELTDTDGNPIYGRAIEPRGRKGSYKKDAILVKYEVPSSLPKKLWTQLIVMEKNRKYSGLFHKIRAEKQLKRFEKYGHL